MSLSNKSFMDLALDLEQNNAAIQCTKAVGDEVMLFPNANTEQNRKQKSTSTTLRDGMRSRHF